MINSFLRKIVWGSSDKYIKSLKPAVNIYLSKELPLESMQDIRKTVKVISLINSFEEKIAKLPDDRLRAKTEEFKSKIKQKTSQAENKIKELQELFNQALI